MNMKEEKALRKSIRRAIKIVKTKNKLEENKLRNAIRGLLKHEMQLLGESTTPDNLPTPNKSTGINVLEDLLKKIIPVLETDYKLLTTDPEQRKSFRSHVVNAVIGALTPAEANDKAADENDTLEEDIDVDVADDDKFIDIRTDAEKSDDEDVEEDDPRDEFGLEGADETGRNVAYNAFKKIQTSIVDSYDLLSNTEDQELFYDYLIANLKLYFDKFEKEITPEVDEPTNQAYDSAIQDQGANDMDASAVEDDLELNL
jgi:hypothetical protein